MTVGLLSLSVQKIHDVMPGSKVYVCSAGIFLVCFARKLHRFENVNFP